MMMIIVYWSVANKRRRFPYPAAGPSIFKRPIFLNARDNRKTQTRTSIQSTDVSLNIAAAAAAADSAVALRASPPLRHLRPRRSKTQSCSSRRTIPVYRFLFFNHVHAGPHEKKMRRPYAVAPFRFPFHIPAFLPVVSFDNNNNRTQRVQREAHRAPQSQQQGVFYLFFRNRRVLKVVPTSINVDVCFCFPSICL